jgi:hypothetical protein
MTYVMTRPCPICKRQLIKQELPIRVTAPAANISGKARDRAGQLFGIIGAVARGPAVQTPNGGGVLQEEVKGGTDTRFDFRHPRVESSFVQGSQFCLQS